MAASASNPSELRWLYERTKRFWLLHAISLLLILSGSVLALVDPLIMKWLIDRALPSGKMNLLVAAIAAFFLVYLARLAVNYAGSSFSFLAIQRLVFKIRVRLLRRLHSVSLHYHENMRIGDLLYRLEADVDQVGQLGGDLLPNAIRMAVTALFILATMFYLDVRLTCGVIPLLPLFYIVRKNFRTKLKRVSDQVQSQAGMMNSFLQEHFTGIAQIFLLNRTSGELARFARIVGENVNLQMKRKFAEIQASGLSTLIIVVASAAILGYGGYEVMHHRMTVGGLVAFYSYVTRLFDPVSSAVELQSRMARAGASIRRLQEIDSVEESKRPASGNVRIPAEPLSMEFRKVEFWHREGRRILNDVSFRIEAGEKVALVGLSGSGKTTIGRLATRLYDPPMGNILIQGRDARDFVLRTLRSRITLVPQDPILFNGTLRENLLYGNPHATHQQIERACSWSELDDVIERIKGLDESLGPQGHRVSGGERKRIALARAMLQQPGILILDEITAALDGPTALRVLIGLDEFRSGCSIIVISHRPSTIAWANRVLVLHEGRIVAHGTHKMLEASSSLYRQICQEEGDGGEPELVGGETKHAELRVNGNRDEDGAEARLQTVPDLLFASVPSNGDGKSAIGNRQQNEMRRGDGGSERL